MGTWGVSAFENDVACDWGETLSSCGDLSLIRDTISLVLKTKSDYLEADDAWEALAACEVIARLIGNIDDQIPSTEAVDDWVASGPLVPNTNLIKSAVRVIDRILLPPSELLDLWQENDAWLKAVHELQARLTP